MAIKQFRKELKELGYTLKLNTNSLGRFATYVHNESKLTNGIVYTKETREKFIPLFDYLNSNKDKLKTISLEEGINMNSLKG